MKTMKFTFGTLCLSMLIVACQPVAEEMPDPGVEAFERNSKTVLSIIEGWENENLDYSVYADDFVSMNTSYGAENDSTNLEQMKAGDQNMLGTFDFRVINDSINLLPGVDTQTKKINGGVRWYSNWEVTKTATDSTEARSAQFSMYQVWIFNDEGKVTAEINYGDFTGLMQALWDDGYDDDGSGDED